MSVFHTVVNEETHERITTPRNLREHRTNKRAEAEGRAQAVSHESTKRHRLGKCKHDVKGEELLKEVFTKEGERPSDKTKKSRHAPSVTQAKRAKRKARTKKNVD